MTNDNETKDENVESEAAEDQPKRMTPAEKKAWRRENRTRKDRNTEPVEKPAEEPEKEEEPEEEEEVDDD